MINLLKPLSESDKIEGYVVGQSRDHDHDNRVSHLYKGTFDDCGYPMCKRGWNRDNGASYSIWRNNVSPGGICKICLKRATEGKEPIPPMEEAF